MADFLTPKTMPEFATDDGPIPEDWAKLVRAHIEDRNAVTVDVMAVFRKKLGDRYLK